MPPRSTLGEPSFSGDVLAVLRVIRGWSQKELAAAAGLPASQISAYERGRIAPPLKTLRRLVAAMELPPHLLERTVSFLSEARAEEALVRGVSSDVAVRMKIDAIAADFARSWEDFARSTLTRLHAEARTLEARCQAPALWARLRSYAPGQRRALVRESAEFKSWALAELICQESERMAAHDAARAVALAELAVEIASLVPEEEAWRRRLEGYTRAFLANARRVAGKLPAAGEAFARAIEAWEAGAAADPAPLDATRMLDLEASLRREQRRLPEALDLLERALAAKEGGAGTARLLLKKARTLEELGDYEVAVAVLRDAAPLLEEERDPRLALVLRFNLAYDLCRLGRAEDAERMLPEIRARAVALGNRLDLVRLRGLEGLVAAGLARADEALALLWQAREELIALDIPYDAASTTLELVVLYLGQGRTVEVKALARESAAIFEQQGVHLEARRALALFRQGAEAERLTLGFARSLLAYLERARGNPALRFEAPP